MVRDCGRRESQFRLWHDQRINVGVVAWPNQRKAKRKEKKRGKKEKEDIYHRPNNSSADRQRKVDQQLEEKSGGVSCYFYLVIFGRTTRQNRMNHHHHQMGQRSKLTSLRPAAVRMCALTENDDRDCGSRSFARSGQQREIKKKVINFRDGPVPCASISSAVLIWQADEWIRSLGDQGIYLYTYQRLLSLSLLPTISSQRRYHIYFHM